jgi:hypothetical protein
MYSQKHVLPGWFSFHKIYMVKGKPVRENFGFPVNGCNKFCGNFAVISARVLASSQLAVI